MSDTLPRRVRAGLVLGAVFLAVAPVQAQNGRDEERFRVAMGLVRRGLHDEAAQQLRQFLDAKPDHRLAREAWYRLGVCYQQLEKAQPAVDAFQQALAQDGPFELTAECRYRLGNTLKGQQKLAPAEAQYRALLGEVAADHYLAVPAAYADGECLRDLDRPEEALAAFRTAAKGAQAQGGDTSYGMPALYQAGFALIKLERYDEASRTFAAAADRYRDHEAAVECRYLEGDAAFRAEQLDRAEAAYAVVAKAGGEFADAAVMGLAWCKVRAQQENDALAMFRRVTNDYRGSTHAPKARLESGRILYRQGQLDNAIAELGPLTEGDVAPDVQVGALELQGLALLDQQQAEAAAERFQTAVGLAQDEATAGRLYYDLGEAFAEQGEWQAALSAYEQAAPRAREATLTGDVLYGQSLALHKLERFDDSIQRAQALLSNTPEHRLAVHAQFSIAENLFASKRYDDADRAYAAVTPDSELADKAAFKRAWCAFLAGQLDVAATRFAALAEPDSGSAFAEEALSMTALSELNAANPDGALQAADRYRARYPQGAFLARTERVAARVLRQSGDKAGAAQRLASAAKAERSETQAAEDVLEQAELLLEQGDYEGASALYGGLAERGDRTGAQALEGMAWCAFELGDDEGCLQHVQSGLAHPQVGDRKAGLVELQLSVYHRSERWDDAQRAAMAFLGEFPKHGQAREVAFGLGVAQSRSGDYAAARQTFAALAQDDQLERPDRLYYEWAWACRKDGDEPAALAAFAKVAELSVDTDRAGEAHLHLGIAKLEGVDKDARAAREYFARVDGEHRAQALYRFGFSWLAEDKPERALPAFEKIVAMGDDEALFYEAMFLAAESHFRMENHDEAVQRYEKLFGGAPAHERTQLARLHGGRSLVLLSRAGDAVTLLEAYLQNHEGTVTEEAEAWLWLGRARAARREFDRAEQAYLKTTELSEGELAAEAQYRIGEARRENGDLNGAVDAFFKVSFLYGHEEWVRKGLLQAGMCYEELQQPNKAIKFYEELIERFPDDPESARGRARLEKLKVQ